MNDKLEYGTICDHCACPFSQAYGQTTEHTNLCGHCAQRAMYSQRETDNSDVVSVFEADPDDTTLFDIELDADVSAESSLFDPELGGSD